MFVPEVLSVCNCEPDPQMRKNGTESEKGSEKKRSRSSESVQPLGTEPQRNPLVRRVLRVVPRCIETLGSSVIRTKAES